MRHNKAALCPTTAPPVMLRSLITRQHRISTVNVILTIPFVVPTAFLSSGVINQQQCVASYGVLCRCVCINWMGRELYVVGIG